jgi:hypothetical protein
MQIDSGCIKVSFQLMGQRLISLLVPRDVRLQLGCIRNPISLFNNFLPSAQKCVGSESEHKAKYEDVAPCSLVEVHQRFRGSCCLHHQGTHRPDGGSKDL